MARLKGGVQLDEVGVVQLVHHLDLIPHHLLRDRQKHSSINTLTVGTDIWPLLL